MDEHLSVIIGALVPDPASCSAAVDQARERATDSVRLVACGLAAAGPAKARCAGQGFD